MAGQEPAAIVLGCSDSRVSPEILFDQGIGDLFVVRVAGNVFDLPQLASVEFAVQMFGTPLVVVLGHSQCGAVQAALEGLALPKGDWPPSLRSIVDPILSSVKELPEKELPQEPEALMQCAVRANVRASAERLRHGSEVLEQLIDRNELLVLGAEYSLESGRVDFFDGLPGV